ncbi:MAG: hypothetical protein KF838_14590 [Phycisphaeraceae bacterium]|nr:MAG: hypothetical protein KF838_14590 [Phycisphaeraceae bacterium]
MASYREITPEIMAPLLGKPELRFLAHAINSLGSCLMQEEPYVVHVHASDAPSVRLRYKKSSHEIASVEVKSSSDMEANEYVRRIHEELVTDRSEGIYAFTAFASKQIGGQFIDSKLRMQVRPAPPKDPRPPFLMGEHPCVVSLKYLRFPNSSQLDRISREQEGRRWLLLLNAFTIGVRARHPYGMHDYAIIKRNGTPQCEYVQLDYWPTHITPDSVCLLDKCGLIPAIPESQYFSVSLPAISPWLRDDFSIPDTLTSLLTLHDQAERDVQERFLRACHWLHTSSLVNTGHEEVRLMCLAAAVESLLPVVPSSPCQSCKRPTGPGPTRLFRDFVDSYMLEIASSRQFAGLIYDLRSKIVHGTHMLGDGLPWLAPFGGRLYADEGLIRDFSRGLRMAFIRWLRGHTVGDKDSQ